MGKFPLTVVLGNRKHEKAEAFRPRLLFVSPYGFCPGGAWPAGFSLFTEGLGLWHAVALGLPPPGLVHVILANAGMAIATSTAATTKASASTVMTRFIYLSFPFR
jgi:hypothetical protein